MVARGAGLPVRLARRCLELCAKDSCGSCSCCIGWRHLAYGIIRIVFVDFFAVSDHVVGRKKSWLATLFMTAIATEHYAMAGDRMGQLRPGRSLWPDVLRVLLVELVTTLCFPRTSSC